MKNIHAIKSKLSEISNSSDPYELNIKVSTQPQHTNSKDEPNGLKPPGLTTTPSCFFCC